MLATISNSYVKNSSCLLSKIDNEDMKNKSSASLAIKSRHTSVFLLVNTLNRLQKTNLYLRHNKNLDIIH